MVVLVVDEQIAVEDGEVQKMSMEDFMFLNMVGIFEDCPFVMMMMGSIWKECLCVGAAYIYNI